MIDYQIEYELLGNILLNPKSIDRLVISDKCFFEPQNKFIFNLLKRQYDDSKTIDITCITENYKHLFTKYTVDEIVPKLINLLTNAMPINNIDYYQETLFSRFIKHKILESINDYQTEKITVEEMLNDIHKYEGMSIKLEDDVLSKEDIYRIISSKNKNINCRFKALSNYANIQEHDLVIVGARTGIGKSAFVLNLLEDLSAKYNCLFFNMEMNVKQVYQRLIAINTHIPMKYHDNPETEYQNNLIIEGCQNLANKKIKIVNSSQSIASIRRKIINETKNGHTLVFIDYVGLIDSRNLKHSNYERVTAITKELRQISLDYDCTIFLVSQLNRNVENNTSKKELDRLPKASDLKESGELEQSATTVLLLYDKNFENNRSKKEIEMAVIIGKNRNGQLGVVPIKYNKENQRYDDVKPEVNEPSSWRKE